MTNRILNQFFNYNSLEALKSRGPGKKMPGPAGFKGEQGRGGRRWPNLPGRLADAEALARGLIAAVGVAVFFKLGQDLFG